MYQILSASPVEPTDGHVDLDFREPDSWTEMDGGRILALMLGDEQAGPFVALSCFPPMDEMMPLSFAHAHASDNWRISVRGTTNMGKDAYAEGQFRFHDGGVPYASDNYAWGPDGGFGIIVFGDRRGFAIQPVKASIAEKIGPEQEAIGGVLGIDMQDPCPGAPAIATTFGPTERAHLNEGFESAPTWPEVAPGTRLAVGLFGEPACGPALLFVAADPGAEVLPARTLGTEVLIAPIAGSVVAGSDALEPGSLRLDEADAAAAPLVAGDAGAQAIVLVSDRRALTAALDAGTFGAEAFRDGVDAALTPLLEQLQPVG